MGGRLDATNIVRPLVSVITTISLDHQAYLGADISSIAREKGGIIKAGVPVVCGLLPGEAASLIAEIAGACHAPVYFFGRDFFVIPRDSGLFDYTGSKKQFPGLWVALKGEHQRVNAALALAALEVQQRFPVTEAGVRQGLETVRWPGRFEIVSSRPTVVLDGAHNGEGVRALAREVQAYFKGKKVKLLFAAMKDKDARSMLGDLSSLASEVILTRVPMERSADPSMLAEVVAGVLPVKIIEKPLDAVRWLLESADPDEAILVAGSLYLLGEVRPYLCERANESKAEKHFIRSSL
jgi:dihydrofolate synthase/folylpolyglutamate synthase